MTHETEVIKLLRQALGDGCIRTHDDIDSGKLFDWGSVSSQAGFPLALILPRNTGEVSTALSLCHEHGIKVVPQGGMTGLVGGANAVDGAVLINLERMRTIEEVDPIASTITVQAGVTLQAVQEACAAEGYLYPLDIGGRGSCTIGGNIATNAGGNRVVRFGMTRGLVLGLEVVLADGTILTSMNKMLKNNTGYDLKQMFIGSEGTLGIITRAVLRVFTKPESTNTFLCAVDNFDDVYKLLKRARQMLSANLSAFEVMWENFYSHAVANKTNAPIATGYPAYILIETMGSAPDRDGAQFQEFVETVFDEKIIADAILPKSGRDLDEIWAIRDASGEMVQALRPLTNYDVSIETGDIGAFVNELKDVIKSRWDHSEVICFGHLADSNVHIFVRTDETPFPMPEIDTLFYGHVKKWGGAISAEIGIGTVKKKYLSFSRSPEELNLMKIIKLALDPKEIMNPTKLLS